MSPTSDYPEYDRVTYQEHCAVFSGDYQHRLHILAARLILAYLERDGMTDAYVWAIQAESGLPAQAFHMAQMTAAHAAALYRSPQARAAARRKLAEVLEELTAA